MRKSSILVTIPLILAISAFSIMVSNFFLVGSQQEIAQLPWIFKGAYATYDGKIDSFSMPYSLKAGIEVTDLNSSHVQVRTNSTIATSFAPEITDQTVLWMSRTNINFQPKGETLARTYNTQITFNGIEPRDCTVYEYTNNPINVTYYIDKALLWPLKIIYFTEFENQTYTLEFNLKETNINGLNFP